MNDTLANMFRSTPKSWNSSNNGEKEEKEQCQPLLATSHPMKSKWTPRDFCSCARTRREEAVANRVNTIPTWRAGRYLVGAVVFVETFVLILLWIVSIFCSLEVIQLIQDRIWNDFPFQTKVSNNTRKKNSTPSCQKSPFPLPNKNINADELAAVAPLHFSSHSRSASSLCSALNA